jgi:hypothetical protein
MPTTSSAATPPPASAPIGLNQTRHLERAKSTFEELGWRTELLAPAGTDGRPAGTVALSRNVLAKPSEVEAPPWKGAKKGPNHSTVPMICRL